MKAWGQVNCGQWKASQSAGIWKRTVKRTARGSSRQTENSPDDDHRAVALWESSSPNELGFLCFFTLHVLKVDLIYSVLVMLNTPDQN